MSAGAIPDNASVDVPPEGLGHARVVEAPPDPDGEHKRNMERGRLNFARWLVACSAAAAVAVMVLEYLLPRPDQSMGGAVDMLKLFATIALGYVFGRSAGHVD